jgi:DNA-binding NarL/FixJ family response regulator
MDQKNILIAEPRETLRKGLHVIFDEEPDVAHVNDAATSKELYNHLTCCTFHLIVVHQCLITDFTPLPSGRFAVLNTEPDFEMLTTALCHGAIAYLSEDAASELFRQLLQLSPGTILIDDVVSAWLMAYLSHHLLLAINDEHLTPREQEILGLLWKGYHNRDSSLTFNVSTSLAKTREKTIFARS